MFILVDMELYLVVLIFISLMINNDTENLFKWLMFICISSWWKLLELSAHLLLGSFLIIQMYKFFVYFGYRFLTDMYFTNIISQSVERLFIFLMVFLMLNSFNIWWSPTYQPFLLWTVLLVSYLRNISLTDVLKDFLLYFSRKVLLF